MVKKKVKRKTSTARKTKSKRTTVRKESLEKQLLENLIKLQKTETHLAEKFDHLSDQLSSLLGLFEMSARSFAKQPHLPEAEKDREFLSKIDKLLDQNKTIAKGLTMMEGKMKERVYGSTTSPTNNQVESLSDQLEDL